MVRKLPRNLTGAAGEHYVVAELCRRGAVASITHRNTKSIDILASNSDGSHIVGIQVKTNQNSAKSWILDAKAERLRSPDLFYVFVRLGGPNATPSFHIVESRLVAESIEQGHREWLKGVKRGGGSRKDTSIREFHDKASKFEGKWHCLNLFEK